ncbi:MAG: chlorophyll synthase ChlG [Hoeflea sp.]|uniref:chlorophyll synthase ChlG n=1 Tax=Hoeflea sp. TaxID=1940281 RepID=UPI001DE59030|nr:chlorophyll synthase ChlG [Hoeflea sp.]MBU4527866.1 chlorophyll synthase ChlG [Alphaproteobacteria bacterium]MBU4546099.1 chlorophyll synthase ChlG [Alphaproteobacteria bacterium]MBU4553216.1 chlorophyll synthase ChlG [Alphaproteobacteria bacterium]MBV1724288.1 chlorophyll synthase ChlG [Hoeflea sp.]MBV1759973.1 chlorophyll synthase ChlG [Hoeflea sp.]
MTVAQTASSRPRAPTPGAVLALLKPVTWFPPMWAFACGAISAGQITSDRWFAVALGVLLAGPLLCGTSQAVNDWFDRHVDAINEPDRVIPSGRMPGRWGLGVAIINSILSMVVASFLGMTVFIAAAIGLALAWAYSAPPFRLKRNGWWGNAACGFSYESLPWITAAAAALGTLPNGQIFAVALLYGAGAIGIMTLNDFKSMEGDTQMGIASLPVQMGARNAALFAGLAMIIPQIVVIVLLVTWGHVWSAAMVGALMLAQAIALPRLVADPKGKAIWYSALGVGLYVTGMMITAFAIRP